MAIKGKFFALPWSCFSFNVAKMDTIIAPTLMMDVRAYSDERSTNKNNHSRERTLKTGRSMSMKMPRRVAEDKKQLGWQGIYSEKGGKNRYLG